MNAGVYIAVYSSGNTIGGTTPSARNVISGNIGGITLDSDSDDVVEGNYIGTDTTGTVTIGNGTNVNGGDGVLIENGVGDSVGGNTSSARNVISGNIDGIRIEDAAAVDNVVAGNYIGTDPTGTIAVPNSDHGVYLESTGGGNTIGGATSVPGTGAGNLFAGNVYGISLVYEPAGDTILGNSIGSVALAGGTSPGNAAGLVVQYSTGVQVGGTDPQYANVISGNTGGVGLGIGESSEVVVQGNFIGTNFGGTAAVPNGIGVSIEYSGNNTIGGTTAGAGNVISGNTDNGLGIVDGSGLDIDGGGSNLVAGNWIGTDALGSQGLGNYGDGVSIYQSSGNTIGGTATAAANVISGNDNGVELNDSGQNLVEGNLIGTDPTGTIAIPNSTGIEIDNGGSGNTIGGTSSIARNILSGNDAYGVEIEPGSNANLVEGNFVGTDSSGDVSLGNFLGVLVQSGNNTIGGTALGAGNVISGNDRSGSLYAGVQLAIGNVFEYQTTDNLVEGNLIGLALMAR